MRARLLCPALRVPGGHGADRRRQGRRGGDGVEETPAHRRRRIWVAGLFHHVIRFGCVADVDATTTNTSGRSGGGLDYALCMPSTAAPGPPDAGAPREQRLPLLLLFLSSPHQLARHVPSDRLYRYLGDVGIHSSMAMLARRQPQRRQPRQAAPPQAVPAQQKHVSLICRDGAGSGSSDGNGGGGGAASICDAVRTSLEEHGWSTQR